MARRGSGGDDLHFDATADFQPARRETDLLIKKMRKLGEEAVRGGKIVDKTTLDTAKGYRALAQEIAAAQKAEDSLTRSAEASRAARARSLSTSAVAGANTRVANGTVGSKIAKSGSEAELAAMRVLVEQERKRATISDARSRASLAAARVETELARKNATVRQQQNRNLMAESAVALQADKREDIHQRQILAAEKERSRLARQRQADEERAAAKALRAAERIANEQKRAVKKEQNDLYGQYMEGQKSHDRVNSVANINATRYALYDVASTAAVVGTAVVALGVYSGTMATQFESNFSRVQRSAELTGEDINKVRGELIDLTTELTANFEQVTEAATLGAQMGIMSQDLDSFARVTTEFASTTNASLDTTAQSFGRISNLLDVPATKFDNLGSAIYQVGIKSVATETEILSTAQQIAGAASAYNFTADQVVGLGAAFASLAIAPEAARGSVTRIFGDIEKAAAKGGDAMSEYARIMNTDVATAMKQWEEDPSAFFNALVDGLSRSKSLLSDLNSIGANDVRDVNLLQRLAGNPEILAKSLDISNQAFQEGTALGEAYAITAETLESKLKVLVQTFQAMAAAGGGPLLLVLKPAVDLLQHFLEILANQPVLAAFVVGLSLLVGGFILAKGATAAAMAGLLALQTVLRNLDGQVVLTGVNLKSLNALMVQTRSMAGVGAMSVNGLAGSFRGAGGAVLGFVKGAGSLALVGLALEGLGKVAEIIDYELSSASEKAETYFGDLAGFADAVGKDTAIYEKTGKSISAYKVNVDELSPAHDKAGSAVQTWMGLQDEAAAKADATTKAVDNQTIAFGENAEAWLRDALANQEGIQKLANDSQLREAFGEFGGNVDEWIKAGLQGDGEDYIQKVLDNAQAAIDKSIQDNGGAPTNRTVELQSELARLDATLRPAAEATDLLVRAQVEAGNTSEFLGKEFAGTADSAMDLQVEVGKLADDVEKLFASTNVASGFGAALEDLYQGLVDGGNSFDSFSESGRTNLENLQNTIVATGEYAASIGVDVNDSLVPLFASLKAQGVDTDALLHRLAANPIIFQAGLDVSQVQAGLANIGVNAGGMTSGQKLLSDIMAVTAQNTTRAARATKKYGGATKDAAKEVRTLSDYVADMNTAFDKAFEFRFGLQTSLDSVTSKWLDIRDAQKEAARALREYRIELMEMKGQKAVLEYQLQVAVVNGNTTREATIRAELAKVNGDIADKQGQIKDASAGVDKGLTGTSEAAIKNREELLALVASYEDYIASLANSGLSQEELKKKIDQAQKDFERQAKQLGYNKDEIKKYSKAFDDMRTIVAKLPKNLTMSANLNPALRALEEFKSRARASGSAAGRGYGEAFGKASKDAQLKAYNDAIRAQIAALTNQNSSGQGGNSRQIQALRDQLIPGYYNGGFVPWGTGAKNKDNGWGMLPNGRTVGLQGGEPIINNRARDYYGDDMFRAINAMTYKQTAPTIVVQSAGSGYDMPVDLGPEAMNVLYQIAQALGNGLSVRIGDEEIGRANERYTGTKAQFGG